MQSADPYIWKVIERQVKGFRISWRHYLSVEQFWADSENVSSWNGNLSMGRQISSPSLAALVTKQLWCSLISKLGHFENIQIVLKMSR
jgi:hypothetical protein